MLVGTRLYNRSCNESDSDKATVEFTVYEIEQLVEAYEKLLPTS